MSNNPQPPSRHALHAAKEVDNALLAVDEATEEEVTEYDNECTHTLAHLIGVRALLLSARALLTELTGELEA